MGCGDSGSGSCRSVFIHEFVTGGGMAGADVPPSLAAEGRAMRRALARDFAAATGVRVVMTLDARLPDEPGPWRVVRVGPGEEPGAFARLAAQADCTLVVAPETGGLLLDRARILDRLGARSLGCAPEAIATAGNVLRTVDRLRRAGVRTPPTRAVRPRDPWPRRITFPMAELARACPFVEVPEPLIDVPPARLADLELEHPGVLKPVDGAGALRTFVLAGEADWPDPSWSPEVAVLQAWIEGQHRSVAALVSADGRPHLIGCAAQRIVVDRRRIRYEGGAAPLPFDDAVARMVGRVVAAIPGLRGWVGIDWIDDGRGDPIALEVNPRPTTSVVAFLASLPPGMLAEAWLAECGQLPSAASPAAGTLSDWVRARLERPVAFDLEGTLSPDGTEPDDEPRR